MSFSTFLDWHTPRTGLTGETCTKTLKDVMFTLRCNYIDVRTDLLTGWGEWRVGQITGAADWFELRSLSITFSWKLFNLRGTRLIQFNLFSRIPYDCSSYVHYYQLQGAFWKKSVEKQASAED